MSDGLPDERRLRAVEQLVLTRIRRRAAMRARLASGAAAAAIVVGAVVLVPPALSGVSIGSSSSGGAGGSAARSSSEADAEAAVRCHETSAAGSPAKTAPLPPHPDAASVAAACARVVPKAASGSSYGAPSTSPASALVVCLTENGGYEVFPNDGHPATLCTRNGLTAG